MNGFGCIEQNKVLVRENFPLPPFQLEIYANDSLEVCFPDPFTIQLYDSLTNPNANPACLSTNIFTAFSWWNINPATTYNSFCDTYNYIDIDSSGTYTIHDTTTRFNYCYADTQYAQKTVYVTVNPKPTIVPYPINISGNPIVCPGGTTSLTAYGAPNYKWFGTNVWGVTDSVVVVSAPGRYTVQSTTSDTNKFGCTATYTVSDFIKVVAKTQPTISASPLVICPGASVDVTSSSPIGNAWEGPNGPIVGGRVISVTDPGNYFTVVNDADSCGLVSNTLTINQYATPSIVAYGDTTICPGATTIIGVQSSPGATITWDPPLTGSSSVQAISIPGTYSCSIVSCGITTQANITIYLGNPLAKIDPLGVLCKDSSLVLAGPPGMSSYSWLPSNDTTPSILVNSAGTYTLSIVDAFGCAGTSAPFTVAEVSPSVQLNNTVLGFCHGDSIVLNADTNLSSYLWWPGGETTSSITVFDSGSYSLKVLDSNGCSTIGDPFFVNQSPQNADVQIQGDTILCLGDTTWLNSTVTGYSSYAWFPDTVLSSSLAVTDSGSYYLVAIDSVGCVIESDTINFSVLDLPISSISGAGVLCQDSFLTLNGPIGMNSYYWMPGNETSTDINISSPGNYVLVVTDSNGCESVPFTYLVNEIMVPVGITNQALGFCEGDSLLLMANSGMNEYLWMPSGDTTQTLLMTEPGLVSLSVVDSNGCVAELDAVSITQSPSNTAINSNYNNQICEGDSVVLSALNQGFDSYSWMPGNMDSSSIVVKETGTFWFVSTDSIGCITTSDSASVEVIKNNLTPPVVSYDSVVCIGNDVLIVADGGSSDVYWYEALGSSPIHVGDSLMREIYSYTVLYVQTISEPCVSLFSTINISAENCDEEPDVINVFTPNGDGVNDGWSMHILGAKCYEVEIYNRWGMLIYTLQSNGAEWNGKVDKSNLDAPEGTYYYILNYCDYNNQKISRTGYITLLR
jgi:gliding motility-associated-like protein